MSARLNEELVEIQVRDQGMGIDPKDHQLIFQEFRQAEGPKGERPNGTGLGLALVRRFVSLHRGTISVESELGKGSTFTVALPRMQPRGAASDPAMQGDVVGKWWGARDLSSTLPGRAAVNPPQRPSR